MYITEVLILHLFVCAGSQSRELIPDTVNPDTVNPDTEELNSSGNYNYILDCIYCTALYSKVFVCF